MGTQGLISILDKDGEVYIKITAGCNGYLAADTAKAIQAHIQKYGMDKLDARVAYHIASYKGLGCKQCLVVQSSAETAYYGDGKLSSLYAEKFHDPHFNPRWSCGVPGILVLVDSDLDIQE
jgi:hypothetical protein